MTPLEVLNAAVDRLVKQYGTQRAAAEAIGVHESYLTHIKQGNRLPSIPVLGAMGIELKLRNSAKGKT